MFELGVGIVGGMIRFVEGSMGSGYILDRLCSVFNKGDNYNVMQKVNI